MCGIAGIVQANGPPVTRPDLESMADSLRHRGPDAGGVYLDGRVGLAHRRLSIIDLAEGAQPMCNEDGCVWVTYNGEIYNYLELHRELGERGHHFKTHSDTEVIVHAYEEWGEDCVRKFRGMFAFAVYDSRTGEVFLARDRLGIKPLVYSVEPHRIAFASELQAIATLPAIELEINHDAIDTYLQLQYIPAPLTIYRHVYKLPPGHTLRIRRNGDLVGPHEYWDVAFQPDERVTEEQWLEQLDQTIREAVRLRLRSDVPFGAFLSGGVDSSLVVAYMSELLDEPVRTFSIGFDEQDFSETEYARIAATRCGTQHHQENVRPDALQILPDIVRHYGEPFGDSSAIPTFCVSSVARHYVKMVLSGDGGDELFAGYPQHAQGAAGAPPQRWTLKRKFRRFAGNVGRTIGMLPPQTEPIAYWLNKVEYLTDEERRRMWRNGSRARSSAQLVTYRSGATGRDLCSALQYLDLKNYLPFDILTKVDIASMYHGLEVRVPLLDHHVVELAARIPARFHLQRDGTNSFHGKVILKKLAGRFYDPGFLNRPKMGFSMPLKYWFRGTALSAIRERLLDPSGRLMDLFDKSTLNALLESQDLHGNIAHKIWVFLFLAEWLRQHEHVRV